MKVMQEICNVDLQVKSPVGRAVRLLLWRWCSSWWGPPGSDGDPSPVPAPWSWSAAAPCSRLVFWSGVRRRWPREPA